MKRRCGGEVPGCYWGIGDRRETLGGGEWGWGYLLQKDKVGHSCVGSSRSGERVIRSWGSDRYEDMKCEVGEGGEVSGKRGMG